MLTVKVLDFSEYPGLRHCSVSDDSGEEFYHKILNKKFYEALEKNESLLIDLDFTAGYAPSFLDEAIGNLVYDFSLDKVKQILNIKSDEEPDWINKLKTETYPQWENRRVKKEAPKKTGKHEQWYRWDNNKIITVSK